MTSMVVCPQPLAAEAGREAFARGGNAADAAVATALAQAVTDPLMCGLGGTALLYYYDAKRREGIVLNGEVAVGSRPIPARWADEFVERAETIGRYVIKSDANQVGYGSIMIPGFVRCCWTLFQKFGSGRVAWADLLAPAIRLADEGFEVYPYIGRMWEDRSSDAGSPQGKPGYPRLATKLAATSEATRLYLKSDGSIYQNGDWFRQPELGRTIRRLAEAGGDDFYSGEIAQTIAADLERGGGFITIDDLRSYQVLEERPFSGRYRGMEVVSCPVPSSGPQLIEMLQILDHFDLAALGHNTPNYIDTFARAQRAVFADYVPQKGATIEQGTAIARELIQPERAAYWAERIKAGDRIVVRGGNVDPGTTHLTCIDGERNIVSYTHSIGSSAGSGVITPGLGFLFNNFLGHFNPLPGQPDSIEPGKRMGGGVPTVLFRDGEPYIAIGSPGGSRLVTACVQSIVNAVDHGMDLKTAVSVPRFHSEEQQRIFLENGIPDSTVDALRELGNEVDRSAYMARVQAIRILPNGELEAGPDPRGGAGVGRYP